MRAPAKINLTLLLGPTREADGRHELVTVFEPLELHDTVRVERAPRDEVVCPGVEGENLALTALTLFREATGWDGPGLKLTIDKRIPVAGGMAGGSADAAAALRIARRESGLGDDALLHELAFALGADVPSQIAPRRLLGTGAGEHLEELPAPDRPLGVLVLPNPEPLSTGAVFREADRLGLARPGDELAAAAAQLRAETSGRDVADAQPLFGVNDLAPAALSLLPSIGEALDAAREAGARTAMVSGSGPTVLGLFDEPAQAQEAVAGMGARTPKPIATRSFVTMRAGS